MDNGENSTASPRISDLPNSVMMDILSRLSMKTLFRCKFVCRTWIHLISDPFFRELHHARPCTSILVKYSKSQILQYASVEESVTGNRCLEVDMMYCTPKLSFPDRNFRLVNSCNGLLCLVETPRFDYKTHEFSKPDLCVCNPFLDQYITIPLSFKEHRYSQTFGFGFCALSKQYKVVQLFSSRRNFEAEVLTIGTKQWRNIGNVLSGREFGFCDSTTLLHGLMHSVDHYDSEPCSGIFVFDFETEKFSQLPLPPLSDVEICWFKSLGVIDGSLCFCFSTQCSPQELDIWVMKEYGVKASWTKLLVVENLNGYRVYRPLIFLSNGNILFEYNLTSVVIYDTKRKSFSVIYDKDEGFVETVSHKPSFVSLEDIAPGYCKRRTTKYVSRTKYRVRGEGNRMNQAGNRGRGWSSVL